MKITTTNTTDVNANISIAELRQMNSPRLESLFDDFQPVESELKMTRLSLTDRTEDNLSLEITFDGYKPYKVKYGTVLLVQLMERFKVTELVQLQAIITDEQPTIKFWLSPVANYRKDVDRNTLKVGVKATVYSNISLDKPTKPLVEMLRLKQLASLLPNVKEEDIFNTAVKLIENENQIFTESELKGDK